MNDYQKSVDWPCRTNFVQGISYIRLIQILLSACIQLFLSFLWVQHLTLNPNVEGSHPAAETSGLYYKQMTIINDDSSIVNKLGASHTEDARVVIYDRQMFIVQATGERQCKKSLLCAKLPCFPLVGLFSLVVYLLAELEL